ncbi:MAG: outer membrane beta-barrel protein, partial [Mucilaginibacter sp.]
DMVDKVQLYDKKSDQASFTGIDDGVKNKTINIKLKEDKKNGSFGKVDAGIGTKKFYQGQLLYNTFKARQKIAAFAIAANTGKTGLGWDDQNKFGESNVTMSEDGGYMMYGGPRWDDMTFFGEGIPLARTGGLHYDNKWDNDKHSINGNFKLGSLAVDGTKNILSQNNLTEGIIFNNSDQTFHNFVSRQKFDGVYQLKIDTTSNLKFTFDGTFKRNQSFNNTISESNRNVSPDGNRRLDTLLNRSNTNILSNADQRVFNASLFYTKKLKKKGRTLSVSLGTSFNERNEKDSLKSTIEFYKKGLLDRTQLNDQLRTNGTNYTSVNSNITYTEPLTSKLSAVINYGLNVNNAAIDRRTFNQSVPGVYNAQVDSLSSDYKLDQLSNQAGLIFNYKGDKSIFNFGTKAASVNFKQQDLFTGTMFKREFINWFPQANFTYKFSQRKSLRLNYYGRTSQPSIEQIQPVRTGNDYLNYALGNPDLTPSFNNGISANFNSYKVLSEMYFSIYASYNYTINPIVNNLITDIDSGKTIYQSVNLQGKNPANYNIQAYLQKKIQKLDINVDLSASVNGSTNYNLVSDKLNITTSNTYQASLNLSKYKQKKYSIYMSFTPNYSTGKSSLQTGINNNGAGYSTYGAVTLYLPLKFQLQTDYNYTYQAKTQTFDKSFDLFTWNASVTKAFLKEENLKLSLSGSDLLNKRTGFSRNGFTQSTASVIRRYFMFSVVYEFNKMGGAKKQ